MLKGNALVGQSGGPTSVINSSLQGVIQAAKASSVIETVYGMKFGIDGFMADQLWNLSTQSDAVVAGLSSTPSSALGSSRYKLKDADLPAVRDALERHNIRYFFLIGGNDTMDTVHRVEAYCRENGYELRGIGIPKTVDNDLFGTDHTPGYPSAARYNALCVQQSGRLARDMRKVDSFVVYQTIGRDAGWLAAATALARKEEGDAPHLIYCPERPFDKEAFLEDAQACIKKHGFVSVVVSEGLKYADGTPVSASGTQDKFGNTEYGAMGGSSVGLNVHKILAEATGLRGEFQITESLPMCAIDRAEAADIERANGCGKEAVRLAEAGETGFMVTIDRTDSGFTYGKAPLSSVAVRAKEMPEEMINDRGNDITEAFMDYIRPLVTPLPEYVSLEA
ncbi:MAG: diphosphate--fructose-6-phosphate 1-phosphotransferase [Spirochaetales bacterium]|nr:diphosphate--fructose-6-phosphate 1-phosphotransferase [Spirochaetales bacterium]